MTGRRIVGNLDAERELAASLGDRRPLPPRVLAKLAAAATLLRAYAEPDDELWTPVPVDPRRLVDVPGLARPRLVHGALPEGGDGVETLVWCATASTERLGARPLGTPETRVSAAAAARVNDRRFFLRMARELGLALPGARVVSSIEELERHLAGGGAAASPTGRWVLKPPFSAAGRGHVSGAGAAVPAAARPRVEAALAAQGELLFEPWVDRVADFGWRGEVTETSVVGRGVHDLVVGDEGRFRGVRVAVEGASAASASAREASADGATCGGGDTPSARSDAPPASADVRAHLEEAGLLVGARLSSEGHRGPFGIDAYAHRGVDGRVRLQPLGEINARLTFGFVARALVARIAAAGGLPPARTVTLRFASAAEPVVATAGTIPLLAPDIAWTAGHRDETVVWLEIA